MRTLSAATLKRTIAKGAALAVVASLSASFSAIARAQDDDEASRDDATLSEGEGASSAVAATQAPMVSAPAAPAAPRPVAAATTYGRYGGTVEDSSGWGMRYNGYFRAPMNIGFGERIEPYPDQSKLTLENLRVPDREFFSWQRTPNAQGPWTEMFFGYGNGVVESKIAVQAFNLTDSSFPDIDAQGAQIGISQAFVSITPDITDILADTRFNLKVGGFWNQYGGVGKYDAGAYDAYLIGRTHVLGAAYRFDFDFDVDSVWFEHGVGAKQPNPAVSHNTKYTLLHHAHVGIDLDGILEAGIHYMHSWTQEEDHQCNADPDANALLGACPHQGNILLEYPPDGSLTVYGADLRLDFSAFGELAMAYSMIVADYASTVDGAIEVAHAFGGGFFNSGVTGVYLNERGNSAGTQEGNGSVHSAQAQYDFSLSTLIGPAVFGNTTLDASLFGMFNYVNSDDDPEADGVMKLKFGFDLEYSPLSWMGMGFRGDHLRPNSTIDEQTFSILSPRLVFRSELATHEEISISYHRYSYVEGECRNAQDLYCVQVSNGPNFPDGYGAFSGVTQGVETRGGPLDRRAEGLYMPPQTDTLTVQATIWW